MANKNNAKKGASKKTSSKNKQPFYKNIRFWLPIGVGVILIGGGIGGVYAVTRPTFEKIYNEYSEKIEDSTDDLLKEFDNRADKNNDGSEGLEDIYDDVNEKMENIYDDGIDEMDDLKENKDSKQDKKDYKKWSDKLEKTLDEESQKIYNKWTDHPDYQIASADEVLDEMEAVVADINDLLDDDNGLAIVQFLVDSDNPDEIQFTLSAGYSGNSDEDLEYFIETLNKRLMDESYSFTDEPHFTYVIEGEDHVIAESKPYPDNDEINFER